MLSLRTLCSTAFVLSLAPLAAADEPSPSERAQAFVQRGLIAPLVESEASRSAFSRARLPPRERRVRVVQATPSLDASGREFMAFAVDVRFGSDEWRRNDVVGCVYLPSGDLFVKHGYVWRPAAFLLGKQADPVEGVCQERPPPSKRALAPAPARQTQRG